MRPLQSIAMGLLVVALTASFHGYDALPDPVGWVLVLLGLRGLGLPQRGALLTLTAIALAVSCVLWVPHVADRIDAVDPSLTWAANLPQLGTTAYLAHSLAGSAWLSGDRSARRWLLTDRTLLVLAVLAPVVVFGGGVEALAGPAYALAALALLLLVWLLFAYSGRPWALPGGDGNGPRTERSEGRARA